MADFKKLSPIPFFFFFTFSLLILSITSLAADNNHLSLQDLNSAIFALSSNGYTLFANAIAVSDISFQILSGDASSGFTLLALPDSALFSLDMSTDSAAYVSLLRFHVIPRRLAYADLWDVSLSDFPYVETLAHGGHRVTVALIGDVVSVDGVRISFPDMHLRPAIAVHGLDGILSSSTVSDDELGFAGAYSPDIDPIPSPTPDISGDNYFDYESFPSTRYLSPENDESSSPSPEMTPESYFNSALVPLSGFFSSEIQEVTSPGPVPGFSAENYFDPLSLPPSGHLSPDFQDIITPLSPSPKPTHLVFPSEWSDSETQFLYPFIWPPESSFTSSSTVSNANPFPASSFNPNSPLQWSVIFAPTVPGDHAPVLPPSMPATSSVSFSPPTTVANERKSFPVVSVPQSAFPWSVPTNDGVHAPPPPPSIPRTSSVSNWGPRMVGEEKGKQKQKHHHRHHNKKSREEETRHQWEDYNEFYGDEYNLN